MFKLSFKSFRSQLAIGGGIVLLYLLLSHDALMSNRIINAFTVGGTIPLLLGLFRLVRAFGTFDLFIYSRRKLWKNGKKHERFEEENEQIAPESDEKLGTYYDYLSNKDKTPNCWEPLLVGVLYLAISFVILAVHYA